MIGDSGGYFGNTNYPGARRPATVDGPVGGATGGATGGAASGIDLTGGIGGILGSIALIIQAGLNYSAQKEQTKQERKALEYQKSLNELIFAREDSAIQRRAQDLRAAGLSPVLAAGSGAGAGGSVSGIKAATVARPDVPAMTDQVQLMMAALKMQSDISLTQQQTKLTDIQQQKIIADTKLTNTINATKQHNLDIYKRTGLPENASELGRTFNDLAGASQGQLSSKLLQGLKETFPWYNKNRHTESQVQPKKPQGSTGSW